MARRVVGLAAALVVGLGAVAAPVHSLDPTKPEIGQHDVKKGSLPGSPLDHLPPHITQLRIALPGGAQPVRPDWSPSGDRLVFLDGLVGNVWQYELATGDLRRVTGRHRQAPQAVLRAHYLSNGDLLLCAAAQPSATDPEGDRFRGELWVVPRPLGKRAPVALGEKCWEGVAVSKQPGSLRVAWNRSQIDFSQVPGVFVQAANGQSQILTGRIAYSPSGRPRLVDETLVVDRYDVAPDAILEVQDFRSLPDGDREVDDELIFSTYFHRGGEVLGVDLESRALTDYSRSPWYEEPEGIDPAGRFVLVERDLAIVVFPGALDIWRLVLDGRGRFERLTFFDRYENWGSDQPVVARDRSRFVFQAHREGTGAGSGEALLLFDLQRWNARPNRTIAHDPFRLPAEPA